MSANRLLWKTFGGVRKLRQADKSVRPTRCRRVGRRLVAQFYFRDTPRNDTFGRRRIGGIVGRCLTLERRGLIIAGGATRDTVHQTVYAQADVDLRLTENTEFLAITA